MKPALGLAVLLTMPLLPGCKAKLETEITVLELLYGETKMLTADFYSSVADCTADDESAAPGSLRERQAVVTSVFADADYQGCTERDGEHFAHFRIPIAFDKDRDGELTSTDHINLVSTADAFLMVAVPQALRNRMEEQAGGVLRARNLALETKITIRNDHGNTLPFQVFSVYIDNQPFIFGDASIPEAGEVSLRLSDVTIDSAIENGSAILMMRSGL